ncbi:unnamed protein product [Nezara viridula]|uniref:Uncharacterized protein n=1 Tax=Nezara viridula TaxID=85310 RepID=A0A9P0E6Y1_NEZVI|nr:unnamed protein product [Nezara viridula]
MHLSRITVNQAGFTPDAHGKNNYHTRFFFIKDMNVIKRYFIIPKRISELHAND